MAKNDLVVKLLLDSGAFGQDIREAERKAKDFSDNIKDAGKTAGDFGKEVGLSAGALGKLGGMLTGAGAVVAAVGAFKSVMESTNATSIKFNSTIAGFEGVLNTFQQSLATFDFTTWLNGMDEVFERHKEWKKLQMELELNDIATNALLSRDEAKIKELEVRFKNATTEEEKTKYKNEALAVIEQMRGYADNFTGAVNAEFLAAVEALEPGKIKSGSISAERAEELLWQALEKYNANTYTTDTEEYNKVAKQIADLTSKIESKNKSQSQSSMAVGENIANLDYWIGEVYDTSDIDLYTAQRQKLIDDNQEIFFLNAIYKMVAEQLNTEVNNMLNAVAQGKKADDLFTTVDDWDTKITESGGNGLGKPKKNGGGTGEIENAEDSIGWLKDQIALKEKERNAVVQGSDAWKEHTAQLYKYKAALAAAIKEQEKYDAQFITTTKPYADDSIASVQNQISEQQKLINTLEYGSIEWRAAVALLVQYNGELDEMMENLEKVQDEMGNPNKIKPEEGSLTKLKEEIAEMEKTVSAAEKTRDSYTYGSDKWKAASEAVDEYMSKLGVLMDMMKKMQEDPTAKKYENLTKANVALSTTISLVDSLGVAFSNAEEQSTRNLQGITNSLSSIASGAMGLIEIYKASGIAAGTASAAAMPFPYNLAAIATIVSTLLSVYSNIDKMRNNKFAEGGIVGGTSYSGDKLFAMVNSGEMILNKRQQGNLANMLGGGGQVEFHISGDSLVGVLNNRQNKRNLTR